MVVLNRKRNTFSYIGKPDLVKAQGRKCFYCGQFMAAKGITRDHLRPRCDGNTLVLNQVLCCVECNRRKGRRPPTEREVCKARRLYVALGAPAFAI